MRVSIPLTGDLAIIQGETYQALTLTFPGDLTTWTPRGQIRTGLLEDAGTLLAEFAFGTPIYDADADTTNIYPTLTASQTANLPKTKWQGTGEYSRSGVYYYDVELESEGIVIKSKTAIVQVVGEVTGSGTPAPSTLETFLIASNNLSEITDPAAARANLEIVGGVKPDWNATPGTTAEILNKPDLTQYATTTALSEGLATKQPIGDYLDAGDIGVSVQPFSANTVIDPNYVATEESFTTAEKNKLAGIESGAQVNVFKESIVLHLGAIDTDLEPKERAAILPGLPYNLEIQSLELKGEGINGAPTGSAFIADLNVNGVSILSTKISIDDGELTSETATVPYVLNTTQIPKGSALVADIDQVGATNSGQNIVLIIDGVRYS